MTRRDEDYDRGYGQREWDYDDGRQRGGYRSSRMQERDEYGQFTGSRGSQGPRGGGYDYDDRGGGRRGYGNGPGYNDRFHGGGRSGPMQERDEYGQFTSSRGSYDTRGGGYDYDDDRGGGRRGYGNGPGYDDRGGRGSRPMQDRDEYGRFTGERGYNDGGRESRESWGYRSQESDYNRGNRGDITDSAGRHYTRESWERAQEGRARGGQHSHGGYGGGYQDQGYPGGYGSGRGGRGGYDDDYGGQGDIIDSAGRHYSRESWERAQEGRSRGGQHSHGGGRGGY